MAPASELDAMKTAFDALSPLEPEERSRAVQWLVGALGVENATSAPSTPSGAALPPATADGGAGSGQTLAGKSSKVFMAEKRPRTAVERIACLAYYLTHARGTATFKTPDLVALNTDAALPKLANPGRDADNAVNASGYLASAESGTKQITSRGEALVEALPDREAVKQALDEHPFKRRSGTRRNRTRPSVSAE